jgi:hypothetical protein
MPWQVNLSEDSKYVKMCYKDEISIEDVRQAHSAAVSLCKENSILFVLDDCLEMTAKFTITDLILLYKTFEESGKSFRIIEAIVLPKDNKARDNVLFYETASLNRGYTIKSFKTQEEALKWLNPK